MQDEVLSIFDQVALDPNEVFGILLCPSCGLHVDSEAAPHSKATRARADSRPAHSLQPGSPVSKVLYLSDIHFDKNYTAGLNAECGEPL